MVALQLLLFGVLDAVVHFQQHVHVTTDLDLYGESPVALELLPHRPQVVLPHQLGVDLAALPQRVLLGLLQAHGRVVVSPRQLRLPEEAIQLVLAGFFVKHLLDLAFFGFCKGNPWRECHFLIQGG